MVDLWEVLPKMTSELQSITADSKFYFVINKAVYLIHTGEVYQKSCFHILSLVQEHFRRIKYGFAKLSHYLEHLQFNFNPGVRTFLRPFSPDKQALTSSLKAEVPTWSKCDAQMPFMLLPFRELKSANASIEYLLSWRRNPDLPLDLFILIITFDSKTEIYC